MFERFTSRARRALVEAQQEARHLGHGYIGTEHVLLGLRQVDEGIAGRVLGDLGLAMDPLRQAVTDAVAANGSLDAADTEALRAIGIDADAVRRKVEEAFGPGALRPLAKGRRSAPPFTARAKAVLERSLREALALGHNYIGTEHVLLALVDDSDALGTAVLDRLGASPAAVRSAVLDRLRQAG